MNAKATIITTALLGFSSGTGFMAVLGNGLLESQRAATREWMEATKEWKKAAILCGWKKTAIPCTSEYVTNFQGCEAPYESAGKR